MDKSIIKLLIRVSTGMASWNIARPHHNHAGHPISFEKPTQFLFYDQALTARGMAHQQALVSADEDSGMEDIQVFARGHKENQIAGMQILCEPWHGRLWDAFYVGAPYGEARDDIKSAFSGDYRNSPG
jgi:hypothetical protein